MQIPPAIRRLAPLTAAAAGAVTLGFAAGGIAAMDGDLVAATAQPRTRLVADGPTAPPARRLDCPRGPRAAHAERWRS